MNSTHTSTDAYRRLSRRHFTKDFKRSVVEHLLSNELTVAEVAREHDLHPNQLCRWRNEYQRQQQETNSAKYQDTSFLPVTVTEPSLANHKMTIKGRDPHLFSLLDQVRDLSWAWMLSYNEERPHESLGNLPPSEFKRQLAAEASSYELCA